jgi:hypothetical protein
MVHGTASTGNDSFSQGLGISLAYLSRMPPSLAVPTSALISSIVFAVKGDGHFIQERADF